MSTDKELLISLISEVRNALIPARHHLNKITSPEADLVRRGITRALEYTTEISVKSGGAG